MFRSLPLSLVLLFAPESIWAPTVASAQDFEIIDPTGQVTAAVTLKRNRMTVVDRTGERFDYGRERRYDSADGRYLGYVDFARDRVLRFPQAGRGNLMVANLRDEIPRFRVTDRVVRPRRDSIPSDYIDPLPPIGGYLPIPTRPRPPQSVLVDSEIVPNAPLPPVRVDFFNSTSRDLQVAIVGLVSGVNNETIRLAPGERRPVTLQRDSGGERVDFYQLVGDFGQTWTNRVVTPVPPQSLYEVVVHQWQIQSIAIDRTGKSPNPIEDINFQGKGIGRFTLPPGNELQSTTIDVKQAALAANNPGAVAPLVPTDPRLDEPSDAPLQRTLEDVLRQQLQNRR